ncbi:MAG: helix-turn-helix domain-containing protein [Oscillospiraceae bacterium]|nr:helix-turn-helix domain-containing protein [Oscillospiraceae bacterium]
MNGPRILPFIRFASVITTLRGGGAFRAYDCRLLYCLRGKGTLTLDDGVRELLPGTLCLYPSGTRYLITGDKADPLELIVLNFDYYSDRADQEASLPPVPDEEFVPEKIIADWQNTGEVCFMTPQVLPGMQLLEGDLLELTREWQVAKIHYREVVSSQLSVLLYRVLQQTSVSPESSERADELLAYIHGHFAERLDYAAIAAQFHYHPYYLNTLIKARTGQPLHRYIMSCRIREACRLLISTDDPVGVIARAAGFENKDHFSACFKKMTGVSPLQYRKGHQL